MDEIRGKLRTLKKKEKSKSRNKVMKNNINDLKELYKEMGSLTIGSGSDLSNNVGNSLRDTRDDTNEVRSQQPRHRGPKPQTGSLLSGQAGDNTKSGKLKYYDRKKYQFAGIHMDLDDEALEGDDDKAGKERQKLIYLLSKREKEMQKKLKQLNEDVNYVMRSRLTGEPRRRHQADAMPVRRRAKGGSLLEKEEQNLRKKLDNYEHEARVFQQKIEKRKGEMMSPNDNKEKLRRRKEKLEEEVRELKQKVKRAESGTGGESPAEAKARHHDHFNNDYMFNYKSRDSGKEEEGWAGHLSKEFRHEMDQERRLDAKNKVLRKEIASVRVRLKKEIEVFLDKQRSVGTREGTGRPNPSARPTRRPAKAAEGGARQQHQSLRGKPGRGGSERAGEGVIGGATGRGEPEDQPLGRQHGAAEGAAQEQQQLEAGDQDQSAGHQQHPRVVLVASGGREAASRNGASPQAVKLKSKQKESKSANKAKGGARAVINYSRLSNSRLSDKTGHAVDSKDLFEGLRRILRSPQSPEQFGQMSEEKYFWLLRETLMEKMKSLGLKMHEVEQKKRAQGNKWPEAEKKHARLERETRQLEQKKEENREAEGELQAILDELPQVDQRRMLTDEEARRMKEVLDQLEKRNFQEINRQIQFSKQKFSLKKNAKRI